MRVGGTEAIKQAVAAGLGFAIVSRAAAADQLREERCLACWTAGSLSELDDLGRCLAPVPPTHLVARLLRLNYLFVLDVIDLDGICIEVDDQILEAFWCP